MSEVCSLANLAAINSLDRRMKVIGNCREWQRAALREPGSSARLRETQRLQEESERRLQALRKERLIREELAESRMKNRRQMSPIAKALVDHVKKYPLFYGALKVASDPLFRCGAGLRKQRKPSSYRAKLDLEGKKKRRKERFTLISDARAKAAKMPDGEEKKVILKAADDFTRNIDAAEKAVLSRDVYHYTDDNIRADGAPTGYLRGSENSDILKRYGLTKEMLQPMKSKFRAEFYIPDQEVFGTDAKPVIVFKGTDLTCVEDIKADLMQGLGKRTDYYERAIKIGITLGEKTDVAFEAAGHSLGAGMASGVGVVTGCQTTAFNPAGLHPNTVAPYNKNVTSDGSNVSAFIVEGEILNSGQDAANKLGGGMIISSARSQQPFLSPARLAPLLVGMQLSSVPTQVGSRTKLQAGTGGRSPDVITRHLMDTVIHSIEQSKKNDQRTLSSPYCRTGG